MINANLQKPFKRLMNYKEFTYLFPKIVNQDIMYGKIDWTPQFYIGQLKIFKMDHKDLMNDF